MDHDYNEQLSDQVATTYFDELSLMERNPDLNPYDNGSHTVGKKVHHTNMYQLNSTNPNIVLYWSICPECKTTRTKKVIGYDNNVARAYVNDIIKDGKPA